MWTQGERELLSHSLVAVWIPFMGAFLSGFLWPIICDLPGSRFRFGVSQGPPVCARASLSLDGFY